MRSFTYNELTICVYTDPYEWLDEFYEIPEGVEYEVKINDLPDSAGFAQIDDKHIFIFKKKDCDFEDMIATVSHEYGHIIEGGFTHNPPQEDEYDELHEQKAEFYEKFVSDCFKLTNYIFSF